MPFRLCTLVFLDKTFSLREVKTMKVLETWLEKTVEITDFEREQLLRLQDLLDFNVHNWNEAELESHFIGPLFTLVRLFKYTISVIQNSIFLHCPPKCPNRPKPHI